MATHSNILAWRIPWSLQSLPSILFVAYALMLFFPSAAPLLPPPPPSCGWEGLLPDHFLQEFPSWAW